MQLYEITENLKQINQMLEDGVSLEELKDALADVDEAFEEKANGILFLIRNMESNIDAIKIEEARLASRRKSIEKQIESIKGYLINNMVATGKTKLDNGIIKASYIKPKAMLNLIDESIVPDNYKTPKVTIALDKASMLADLKNGIEIDGASIGESKAGLSIK